MGDHDIEDEFVFKSIPGFVFHDSQGFEYNSFEQLELIMAFMKAQGVVELEKQIHCIW